jgi:hypothetical protein
LDSEDWVYIFTGWGSSDWKYRSSFGLVFYIIILLKWKSISFWFIFLMNTVWVFGVTKWCRSLSLLFLLHRTFHISFTEHINIFSKVQLCFLLNIFMSLFWNFCVFTLSHFDVLKDGDLQDEKRHTRWFLLFVHCLSCWDWTTTNYLNFKNDVSFQQHFLMLVYNHWINEWLNVSKFRICFFFWVKDPDLEEQVIWPIHKNITMFNVAMNFWIDPICKDNEAVHFVNEKIWIVSFNKSFSSLLWRKSSNDTYKILRINLLKLVNCWDRERVVFKTHSVHFFIQINGSKAHSKNT